MSVNPHNTEVLQRLTPIMIKSYLKAQGWRHIISDPMGSTWVDADQHSIFLPSSVSFGDYPLHVADILSSLSQVQNQPIEEIYNLIITTDNRDDIRASRLLELVRSSIRRLSNLDTMLEDILAMKQRKLGE